jgi:hypothetical protein
VNGVVGIELADFLERTHFLLLEDVPLNIREGMSLQHDSALIFTTRANFLEQPLFGWISHVGLIFNAPLSHDLSPLHFLLSRCIREKVYATETRDRNH